MLDIQRSIKKIIERFVLGKISLTSAVVAGSTTIPVTSARRFQCGDNIVIYDDTGSAKNIISEWKIITDIPDNNSIVVNEGLEQGYSGTVGTIQQLIGFETGVQATLESVYLGGPSVIQRFPAITIQAKSRSSEWLTLESTSETFEIDITVYVTAADYQSQYELMHHFVSKIEQSLFRTFYPLVEPFDETTLAEDVAASDSIIKLVDEDMLQCKLGWFWFENFDFLRANRARNYLGNGVYDLVMPVGRVFSAGDKVILPHRHIYNTLPSRTDYGAVNTSDGMLQAAVISWTATEEVRRGVPFRDPLTF